MPLRCLCVFGDDSDMMYVQSLLHWLDRLSVGHYINKEVTCFLCYCELGVFVDSPDPHYHGFNGKEAIYFKSEVAKLWPRGQLI